MYVHDLLVPAADRHNAEIYRKVRIADVVDIKHLTSDPLGRLALMGHLDFVVTDRNHDPQFAIEFDGGGHESKNDHLKDEICRQSKLALFRLTQNSTCVQIREASFVAYLVDVWFYGQEFARMQATGELGPDEPFMMSAFLRPNAKNVFDSEFYYVLSAMARLKQLLNTGNPVEHLNAASISMTGPEGQYAAFAQHGNFCGSYRIAVRTISWGDLDAFSATRELSEFCHALAYHDLCEDIKACRSEPPLPRPVIDIPKEIAYLKSKGFRLVLGFCTPDDW
ncbi:conserved hypothetical protein [Methylocella tundrae]|nr:conserved hypothetical protein [Methylocella tundrae]